MSSNSFAFTVIELIHNNKCANTFLVPRENSEKELQTNASDTFLLFILIRKTVEYIAHLKVGRRGENCIKRAPDPGMLFRERVVRAN